MCIHRELCGFQHDWIVTNNIMKKDYFKNCLAEVESKVKTTPKNAPAQRRLSKQKFSFSNLPAMEQLNVWDYVWHNSQDFWVKMQSFLYCESQVKDADFLRASWDVIKHWQNYVNNWGECDSLSKLYTKILELLPKKVLAQLKQWNKSTNFWDRRQSVVSLLYFSRTKKVILPYNTIIPFINKLIGDEEYYVQKGVGWSLKELYNVYPKETFLYLEDDAKKVSPIAFTIAIEKRTKNEKEKLKKKRKSGSRQKV